MAVTADDVDDVLDAVVTHLPVVVRRIQVKVLEWPRIRLNPVRINICV